MNERPQPGGWPEGMVEEIERFLVDDAKRPPGLDSYEDVFKTNLFFPLQRRRELEAMMRIARSINPVTVMEIGADKGAGVYHWVKCLPTVRAMIACEIRGCPYQSAMARAFPEVEFMWMERPSLPPPDLHLHIKIDVLFIDGDKSAFLEDFDAYLPLMNLRGVVFMHDINERGRMRDAFEAVKARGYRTEEIIDKTDTMEALLREERGVPPSCPHEAWLRHWRGRSCGVGVIYLSKE